MSKKKYLFLDSEKPAFSGRSHYQLEKMIRAAGILRQEIDTMSLEDYNFEQYPIIVAFGKKCLKYFKQTEELTKYRGSFYKNTLTDSLILYTHAPLDTLRGDGKSYFPLPASIYDLKKAKRLVEQGTTEPHNPKIDTIRDVESIREFLSRARDSKSVVSFDIETTSLGYDQIRCIGFSASTDYALVVPVESMEIQERLKFLDLFKEQFHSKDGIKWIAQNGQFDINYMRAVWGIKECGNYHFDTMFAHATVFPEAPHDLGTISSIYTDIPYFKNTSKEDLYHYNGLDAVATRIAYDGLREDLKKLELEEYYFSLIQPLTLSLMDMSYEGIPVDKEYNQELKRELSAEIKETQESLDSIFRATLNQDELKLELEKIKKLQEEGKKTYEEEGKRKRVSSAITRIEKELSNAMSLNTQSEKQVKDYLLNTLKLKPVTSKGKISVDKTAINKMFLKTEHPSLKLILKLRNLRLLLSNWGDLEVDDKGRVHTTYKLVETHRLSSGKFEAK